jgi:hypothetical protein
MGADKLAENSKYPKIYLPKLSAQAQKFGNLMKKGFIGCPYFVCVNIDLLILMNICWDLATFICTG